MTFDSIEGTASALSNFTITGGNAYDGGGIYCSSSAPTIKDNIITGNVSETYGGGISCNYSSPIIMNNTITSNSAIYGGGISFDRYTSSVIKGNNINGNSAEEGGGIGCFTFSSPTITNNTIAGNSASTNGGGIYCYYISSPSVTNTIIWDNTAPTDPNISVYFSDPFFNYSDIEGGWEGDGNIDADPLFCDPENGDLTVQSDSPVLGAGQDGADMGAYGVGCEPDDVCSACNIYYTDGYPGFCCDMAWDEGGLTCLYVEAEWGLDCGGCNCFGDLAFCEEQGLMMCSDYSCAESSSQCPPECDLGDINCDGDLNVLDVVLMVNMILEDEYDEIADINEDGVLNVLDVVILVNLILDGEPVCEGVEDIDGNCYETIQIGDQLWMAENLKTTHYQNGDDIPHVIDTNDWDNLSIGAYCEYENNPINSEIYGRLYNWYTIDDSRGVCPEGFHVPSDGEIKQLEMFLGMSQQEANGVSFRGTDQGSQLAGRSDLWNDGDLENNPAFDLTGFVAIPGGARIGGNTNFIDMGRWGDYWSSTVQDWGAWVRNFAYYNSASHRQICDKHYGMAIRCLGD